MRKHCSLIKGEAVVLDPFEARTLGEVTEVTPRGIYGL